MQLHIADDVAIIGAITTSYLIKAITVIMIIAMITIKTSRVRLIIDNFNLLHLLSQCFSYTTNHNLNLSTVA